MSIPEACIEAAKRHPEDFLHNAEARARRVILALADHLPESAIEAACETMSVLEFSGTLDITKSSMRAAMIAALKEVGGE